MILWCSPYEVSFILQEMCSLSHFIFEWADQKDAEIAMLTKKLDQVTQEVETLKKKRSLHTQEGLNGIRIGTVL